jgi:hypothetical protein
VQLKVARKATIKKAAMHAQADDAGLEQFLRCDAESGDCMI